MFVCFCVCVFLCVFVFVCLCAAGAFGVTFVTGCLVGGVVVLFVDRVGSVSVGFFVIF